MSLPGCATTFLPSLTDPGTPLFLTVTVRTSTSITLQWQDNPNNNNELGFQIIRADSPGGPCSIVGTVGANVTSFTDPGLEPSTTYYYTVAAFN
jgi:titin